MQRIIIVGAGKHMQDKLWPALKKLRDEGKVELCGLCRQDPSKGDNGLDIPVFGSLSEVNIDYDLIVASGSVDLHLSVIKHSIEYKKPCFVEKPHSKEKLALSSISCMEDRCMIDYNFNFMPILDNMDISEILCGTPSVDDSAIKASGLNNAYSFILHYAIIHPISVLCHKYGSPLDIQVGKEDSEGLIKLDITLEYSETSIVRKISYSSDKSGFYMCIKTENGKLHDCKPYKAETYYSSLAHFVSCNETKNKVGINNLELGNKVVDVINKILEKLT